MHTHAHTCVYTRGWRGAITRHVAPHIEVRARRGLGRIDNPFNPKNIAPQMGEKSVSQSVTSVWSRVGSRSREKRSKRKRDVSDWAGRIALNYASGRRAWIGRLDSGKSLFCTGRFL